MTKPKTTKMIGYKGFDENWKCRDKQYTVGKTSRHTGEIKLCGSGLHFCENPLDLFGYYAPADSKFATVEASGVSKDTDSDSKRVARSLNIKAEIGLHGLIDAGIKFILSKVDFENATESNTGHRSAASNTGDYSAASNTGDRSAASNTGHRSAASNTGYRSAASVKGKDSVAIVTGYDSKASGARGCWIVLTERGGYSEDYEIKEVRAVKVDGRKIKANKYYKLIDGEVVEAD
jgi:hypothetical protein